MLVPYHPQRGAGLPVFHGMAVQSGRGFGSALSGFMRNVILPVAKTVGKSLAQKGLKTASGVLGGVAHGKGFKQALFDELSSTNSPRAPLNRIRQQAKKRKVSVQSKVQKSGKSAFGKILRRTETFLPINSAYLT